MKSALTALAVTLGIAGVAFAAAPAFEKVDRNGDGMISRTEATSVEGLDFDAADQNGDGVLSRAEYAAAGSATQE